MQPLKRSVRPALPATSRITPASTGKALRSLLVRDLPLLELDLALIELDFSQLVVDDGSPV